MKRIRLVFDDLLHFDKGALWVSARTTLAERNAIYEYAQLITNHERERIEKLLVALTTEQCDPNSAQFLNTQDLIAFIKDKRK
jgi:hypothetical protein